MVWFTFDLGHWQYLSRDSLNLSRNYQDLIIEMCYLRAILLEFAIDFLPQVAILDFIAAAQN
jgi:hypothetical protein